MNNVMPKLKRRKILTHQEDFALFVIFTVILCSFMLLYHEDIWTFMDWVMTTTENFEAAK